ncbi:MAG TPA: DNA-3-methyladenine glycosylase I [Rhizomicrobium sp.]
MSAEYCRIAPEHPLHGPYHGGEYGFPARDDAVLFERLVLEINQAGLSWLTVLKKRDAFKAAFAGYDIDKVAAFTARDVTRLMNDAGIIRNRLKIAAVIENAKRLRAIRDSHGSFAAWLDAHHPLSKERWVKLFKETFRFTGGEIVGEFLMSLGYLKGAHVPSCPVHQKVLAKRPPWTAKNSA